MANRALILGVFASVITFALAMIGDLGPWLAVGGGVSFALVVDYFIGEV